MIKIAIVTQNIGGDEELAEALREIIASIDEGDVEGDLLLNDNEHVQWAVNKPGFTEGMTL